MIAEAIAELGETYDPSLTRQALGLMKLATQFAAFHRHQSDSLRDAASRLEQSEREHTESLDDQVGEEEDELDELRAKVSELESALQAWRTWGDCKRNELVFRNHAYWRRVNGGEEGPFCPWCVDNKYTLKRMVQITLDDDELTCVGCGNDLGKDVLFPT